MANISYLLIALILWVMNHSSLCENVQPYALSLNKCKKHEQQALLKFKQSFTKDPMNRLSSWVGEDCCQWRGVYCDDATGSVIKLNLRSQSFYFDDDQELGCGSNSVTSLASPGLDRALLGLTELTHLDLSWNDFNGSQIPTFIESFKKLRYLNLSSAGFGGDLPPQLGYLSHLVILGLSSQCYAYDMSSRSLNWASNLSKLQILDLNWVDLSRANDTMLVLSRLPSLTMLSLAYCKLGNIHLLNFHIMNSSALFFGTLKHLDLSSNNFEGHLPASPIGNISSLVSLDLGSNKFNGSFPLWLRTLMGLEFLDLSSNAFNDMEEISVWGIMGNPCNFKHLDLSGCRIKGNIVEHIANVSRCANHKLEYLGLTYNKLNGTLPSFLGNLTNMKHLDLSDNGFYGLIPSSLAGLSALNYLALSNNQLRGVVHDILGNLTEIEVLHLSSLNLQGIVPSNIANFSKLWDLDMSNNYIDLSPIYDLRPRFHLKNIMLGSSGSVPMFPKWLKNQTQMTSLDLSNNSMSGEIPNWLWNMTNLGELDLSYNHLTGSITNLSPNIEILDLSNNFLSGLLPRHIDYNTLLYVYLHNNMFSGVIPSWIGNLNNILHIDLSSNRFSGKLFEEKNGSSLLRSPFLVFLDLSENELSGKILFNNHETNWHTNMYVLLLRGNRLGGQVPAELCSLIGLSIIDFAENHFTGHISPCFGSFMSNPRGGVIASIRETLKRRKEVTGSDRNSAPIIDLSKNFLTGEIPEELTNLSNLIALNLSYNHLTGGIPQSIGSMKSLESLDLSNNQLSGNIPQSLSSLNFLESFNLSSNNLHGQIPTGNQLQTLDDPSAYNGNPGLCGFPLPNNCSMVVPRTTDEHHPDGEYDKNTESEDKIEKIGFGLVIMSGVAAGFWGVVGILVLNKRWRVAHFRSVEDIMAKCKCV